MNPWLCCHFRARSGPAVACVAYDQATRRIVEAAPLLNKFHGQPVDNLVRWMKTIGGKLEWHEGEHQCSQSA